MTVVRIGYSGLIEITPEQADALEDYYNSLYTERGYLKRAYNKQAIVAVDTALAVIGLKFVPMSTPDEGYFLDVSS